MIAKYPDVTVLFRPFNEMNGDWCNYCAYHTSRDPQIYVELYRFYKWVTIKNGKITVSLTPDTAKTGSTMESSASAGGNVEPCIHTNPNLLDNWYFGNPVNQRGATSYIGGNYTIDRWTVSSNNTGASLAIEGDGVVLSATSDKAAQFIQGNEFSDLLVGKTITFSALVKDVSGRFGVSVARSKTAMYNENGIANSPNITTDGIVSMTFTVPDVLTTSQFLNFVCTVHSGSSAKLIAVKLELGDTQTLAHKDASGNWVLNEIPDYGEQLRKCQRYQLVVGRNASATTPFGYGLIVTAGTLLLVSVPTPVTMRADANVTFVGNVAAAVSGQVVAVTATKAYVTQDGQTIVCTLAGNAAAQNGCTLRTPAGMDNYVLLDCNL